MSNIDYLIKITYQSPYSDDPNMKYETKWMNLKDFLDRLSFKHDDEIEFTNGGYLRLKEMEPQYTLFEFSVIGLDTSDKNKEN